LSLNAPKICGSRTASPAISYPDLERAVQWVPPFVGCSAFLFSDGMSFKSLNAPMSYLLCSCIHLWLHSNGCSAAFWFLNVSRSLGLTGYVHRLCFWFLRGLFCCHHRRTHEEPPAFASFTSPAGLTPSTTPPLMIHCHRLGSEPPPRRLPTHPRQPLLHLWAVSNVLL
jgi:hypothetical protein